MAGLFQSPFHLWTHLFSLNAFLLVLSVMILATDSISSLASLGFGAGWTVPPQSLWAVTTKSLWPQFPSGALLWSPLLFRPTAWSSTESQGVVPSLSFTCVCGSDHVHVTSNNGTTLIYRKMLEWAKAVPWCCPMRGPALMGMRGAFVFKITFEAGWKYVSWFACYVEQAQQ